MCEQDEKLIPDPPESFTIENTLAQELNKLNFQDRDFIQQEIHGVKCRAVNESPELLRLALIEFDLQVNEWKESSPFVPVLRNVVRTTGPFTVPSNCYVNDPDMRLRFLRCELFNVEDAVQRFVFFLEFMYELFGDFIADRPARVSDFIGEEKAALMSSRNQFLPYRDRSGRQVFIGVGNCNFHMELKLRMKVFMFLHWTASDDIETQKKGLVIIGWFFDETDDFTWEKEFRPNMSKEMIDYQKKQNRSLPVRVASWHHYYMDTMYFRFLARLYIFSSDQSYRAIYKVHFGSQMELRYKLSSYGVSADLIPISNSGTLKYDNLRSYLRMWEMRMSSNLNDPKYREIVPCPRSMDVVFRKGPATKHNRGNEIYRTMVEDYRVEHFRGDKAAKYDITMSIVNAIEAQNGRFLEWKNGAWLVFANIEDARKKIAAGFKQKNRNYKKESQELIDNINNVIAIEDDRTDQQFCCENSARSYDRKSEYAFLENPAKRLKTAELDEGCSNSCFGMRFCTVSSATKKTDA